MIIDIKRRDHPDAEGGARVPTTAPLQAGTTRGPSRDRPALAGPALVGPASVEASLGQAGLSWVNLGWAILGWVNLGWTILGRVNPGWVDPGWDSQGCDHPGWRGRESFWRITTHAKHAGGSGGVEVILLHPG